MRHILQIFFVLLSIVGFSQTWTELVGWQEIDQDCDGGSASTEIFISEVYDSNGSTYGVIELHNPTNVVVNLSQYRMRRKTTYGEGAWSTGAWNGDAGYQLSGNIPPNQTFLIIIPGSDNNCSQANSYPSNLKLTLSSSHGINERDQIQLLKSGGVVDDFQAPNLPPYTGGSNDVNVTNNGGYTVRRKVDADVPKAVHDWADWDVIAAGTQDCSNLGSHIPDNPQPPDLINIEQQTTSLCYVPPATLPRVRFTFQVNNPPYQYSLNGGAFLTLPTTRLLQLLPGNYTIVFKDANDCTVTATFTVRGGIQISPIILLNP